MGFRVVHGVTKITPAYTTPRQALVSRSRPQTDGVARVLHSASHYLRLIKIQAPPFSQIYSKLLNTLPENCYLPNS
jgi:hypothetical protein